MINLNQIQRSYKRIRVKVLRMFGIGISDATLPLFIPSSCYGCFYLHGENIVCALHPEGLESCLDRQIRLDVEEKLNLWDLLYSEYRIKQSRDELMRSPIKIFWLLRRGKNRFPREVEIVSQVNEFSKPTRQHLIDVLETNYNKPVLISLTDVSEIFIILMAIFFLLSGGNGQSLPEKMGYIFVSTFSWFALIYSSHSLILKFYYFVLFQYLDRKNLVILKTLKAE